MPLFPLRNRPLIKWLIEHPWVTLIALAVIGGGVGLLIWYLN